MSNIVSLCGLSLQNFDVSLLLESLCSVYNCFIMSYQGQEKKDHISLAPTSHSLVCSFCLHVVFLHCRASLSIFHWQLAEIILGSCLSLDPGLNVLGTGASSISASNLWNHLPPAAHFSSLQKFSRFNFRFSFIS